MGISDDIRPVEKSKNVASVLSRSVEGKKPQAVFDVIKQSSPSINPVKENRKKLEDDFFGGKSESKGDDREPIKKSSVLAKVFNKKTLILYTLILFITLVLINYKSLKSLIRPTAANSDSTKVAEYEGEIVPQDYTSAYQEDNSDVQTDTPGDTTSVADSAAIDKASIKVSVLNGNGIRGEASQIRDTLVADGYIVPSVANARKFTYQTTIIYYRPDFLPYANAIKALISTKTSELTESSDLTASYEIVVVLGKN